MTARDVIANRICRQNHGMGCRGGGCGGCRGLADDILKDIFAAPDSVRQELAALLNPWRPIETAPYEAISRARLEALMAAARVLISMDHDHDDDVHQNECPWCKSLAALSAAMVLQKRPQQIPPSNLIEGLSAIREALIYDLPLAEIDWMGYLAEAISRLKTGAAVPEDIAGLIGEADREVFNEYFDRDKLNSLVKRLVAALRPLAQENESLTTERDTMMKCVIELKAARDNQP